MMGSRRGGERGDALKVILIILATLVLLTLLLVSVVLWVLRHYVRVEVDPTSGRERVEISTPIGGVTIEKAEDVARRLKLPVYPGAEATEESVSMQLWGEVADEAGGLDIAAAKFRSSEPLDSVDTWYRGQLGPEFKREVGRVAGTTGRRGDHPWRLRVERGEGVLFSHEEGGRLRCVILQPRLGRTEIALLELREARHQ
ncbi:MAG: hypothetical protein HYY26_03660 [Acidobacteria bacterium]|nr:hypothetical protein [Acidobacteriota bacterium]